METNDDEIDGSGDDFEKKKLTRNERSKLYEGNSSEVDAKCRCFCCQIDSKDLAPYKANIVKSEVAEATREVKTTNK